MGRVIVSMSMSIDGFVASDRQHTGAMPEDDELVQWRPTLFGQPPAAQYLTPVESKLFECGVVVHNYRPRETPAAEWAPAGRTSQEA